MAIVVIPIRSDLPAYDFQIELEGVLYGLSFSYNTRAGWWVMDILDVNEEPVLMGVRMITGWLMTERFVMEGKPPGDFFILDTSGKNEDPGQNDFGTTKLLMYADSTEALNV